MRIGIDFGTTRVVVAAVDRGNYPLVFFETPEGQMHDWFPPVIAANASRRLYGWEAIAVQDDEGWSILRSPKRLLRTAGPKTKLQVGGESILLQQLMAEMMSSLRTQLLEHSNLGAEPEEQLEAVLGVPANANSNQRFLTEQATSAGGFTVLGIVNEPSAAAIEFAYRNSAERKHRSGGSLLVYDLGGGTFDISLVKLGETEHTIEASDGLPQVGGDDFDEILANLSLEAAKLSTSLTANERRVLLDECREKKEALSPNTRKVTIDLERIRSKWEQITFPADLYYERCRPLIESTREVVERLLTAYPAAQLDTLYVTGGGSELPPVARVLRETFGRRVRRSAYMRSASAVGLAIRAAAGAGRLHEQFNLNFGIWREAESGGAIVFDLIFPRGMQLPETGQPALRIERAYKPVHNIGHFRYLECSHLDDSGQPVGEITNWEQIQFPFDPQLENSPDLKTVPVRPMNPASGILTREVYTCDANGSIRVAISSQPTGNAREYVIEQLLSN
ncbi:MAG TPA: Hsp70 family protein [Terracidiphilus sp.]|jgi:molecular chaperone DnaK (HSP70)